VHHQRPSIQEGNLPFTLLFFRGAHLHVSLARSIAHFRVQLAYDAAANHHGGLIPSILRQTKQRVPASRKNILTGSG
jgi:hypothetical protein